MALLSCPIIVLVLNIWFAVTNLMSLFFAFNSGIPPTLLGPLDTSGIKIALDRVIVNRLKKGRGL